MATSFWRNMPADVLKAGGFFQVKVMSCRDHVEAHLYSMRAMIRETDLKVSWKASSGVAFVMRESGYFWNPYEKSISYIYNEK